MAVAKCAKITATVTLELTERELLILHHVCSYDLMPAIGKVDSYCKSALGQSVDKEEVEKTIHDIRDVTGALMSHIDKTKLFSQQTK